MVFEGGSNIALKVPAHLYDATLRFYRDVLNLPMIPDAGEAVFAFGSMRLWIDRLPALSQPELWLELRTDDPEAAAADLAGHGVPRCDVIEALPDDFPGFWVAGPGGVVHLVCRAGD